MLKNKNQIIRQVQIYLKKNFKGEPTGHDWWHSWRVWQMAKIIAKKEGGNFFVIELAALLHDIEDWKFSGNAGKTSTKKAKELLTAFNLDTETLNHISDIIENVSFKGAQVQDKMKTLEGKIVQDADRLDVIGAIGIARIFAYGGFVKREIFNPAIKPKLHKSFKDYKTSQGTSINHFYEKVLLLKDRLHTKTAKSIVQSRHQFLRDYLKQFFKEWNVKI